MKEVEAFGNSSNAESDLQLIMQSEKFQHILLVMERSILLNTLQPKVAAYRQLPVLEGKLLMMQVKMFSGLVSFIPHN